LAGLFIDWFFEEDSLAIGCLKFPKTKMIGRASQLLACSEQAIKYRAKSEDCRNLKFSPAFIVPGLLLTPYIKSKIAAGHTRPKFRIGVKGTL
jgi:hypothetical protein